MSYLKQFSARQRRWSFGTLIVMLAIVAIGWLLEPKLSEPGGDDIRGPSFTTKMTIRQIAPQLGATGFAVAKEMHLPPSVDKDTALDELGVEQTRLDEVAAHLLSHRGRAFKYYLFAALSLFGLVWLTQLGRPDDSTSMDRKTWYARGPYIAVLIVSVTVCGFLLGKSPNPMEGAVKIFKGMVGLQSSIPAVVFGFVFFVGLAIVGNKLVCGWACPFGVLQELIFSLPILKRFKRNRKVPFWISNSIRGGLFLLFLLMLFGIIGGKKGFVIYHFVNPFNVFNLKFELPTIAVTVILALGLSFAVYRPFCQFICPFGFVSWLAERFSLVRVLIDHDRCNQCGACAKACPLPSAQHIVEGRRFATDCYSCARCLRVCPDDALRYGFVFTQRNGNGQKTLVELEKPSESTNA